MTQMLIRTLTVIGGGSAYAPGLVAALLRESRRLALREIRLHDVDANRLETVARLCRAMTRAADAPFSVRGTTDLEEAVRGAGAVLNSARPGGFDCRRLDETIPLSFGIPGQETVGPGGFLFALRSVPQAFEVASAMEQHAPNSILLNYTNPTNIVTQALLESFSLPVLGLCDQADDDVRVLALACGRTARDIRFACCGLNHATWYSHITFGGEPFRGDEPGDRAPAHLDEDHRIRYEVCREMAARHPGRWPNSYLAYYEQPERFVNLARRIGPRTDAILESLDDYYRHFEEQAGEARPVLSRHRGTTDFGDLAVRVLVALGSKTPHAIPLNVANGRSTDRFDPRTVVEAVVDVDRAGVHKREAPSPPEPELARLHELERYQRLTARAAVSRQPAAQVEALAANPLVEDELQAEAILARAREAYGPALVGAASV